MSSLSDGGTGNSETIVTISEAVVTPVEEPKRKGRKPKQKQYFGPVQEEAVRNFLTASTYTEKNAIYNEHLRFALNKMIESIIRRYKLYRLQMEYEDIHADTLSFLITKCDKFKPEKGKKAYSYFGTICKNYLMGQIMKDQKERNRKISYEDIAPSIERGDERWFNGKTNLSYEIYNEEPDIARLIKKLLVEIKNFMAENKLTDNEAKIGVSLIEIFENFEEIFIAGDGNKFNKNVILYQLREMTSLTTKEIRIALKRYKIIYTALAEAFRNT